MNTVLILIDSLNRHALNAYGPSAIATPNLDRFAKRAWQFDNHFVGSLPCIPARREIFAGFKEMMWRPWGSLEPFDERLPHLLEDNGYTTALVTDHYHYWEEPGNGYMQSFQGAELIRGHEMDFWKHPLADDEVVPQWVKNIERWRPGQGRWYYANVQDFKGEEDYFPAKTFTTASRWLRDNSRKSPFYLHIESFDVHEPFDVPEPYASMYGDATGRERYTVWPPYQDRQKQAEFFANTTPEELDFLRSQYAGKLTMTDKWFGELLNTFDDMNLWDDTMVIVTTDHGHELGEREGFGKSYPHWDTHANIPMWVWNPNWRGNGRNVTGLTSTVDLFATVLEAGGVAVPERSHSRSIMPLLSDEGANVHDALLYGTFGQGVCCTDGEWTIFKSPEHETPLYSYSSLLAKPLGSPPGSAPPVPRPVSSGDYIPGTALPQWKIPRKSRPYSQENFLFHRPTDPRQQDNLWRAEPEQRERMLNVLVELLNEEGCPPEQYGRLGLTSPEGE